MSQQPPSSPYGGPPGPYPPEPYPQGPGEPPRGRSNKAKFWIGVLLTIPALFVAGVVTSIPSAVLDGMNADPAVGAVISLVLLVAMLGLFITGIVLERTRWFALGLLAGTAVLFVVAAGACVALLFAYSSSYG